MDAQKLEQTEIITCNSCGLGGQACTCRKVEPPLFDPWIGRKLNDQYEILSLIARGGMGSVYRARHLLLETTRAVKVMRQDLHNDDVAYQRFKQEAQAVIGLSHPNIVSFHEFGMVDGTPYVIMDLIEGKPLDLVIKEEGQLEKTRALEIFIQVAAALAHAHNKNIFHRDIKPSNIMLIKDPQGQETVKVLDFGIAKIQSTEAQKLTGTGEIFGSPQYMSPEQGRGQEVDARSDVYSLGCVMFETLTGKPPFQGVNALETIMKHLHDQPSKMFIGTKKTVFDPVLQDLEAIVACCLEKTPSGRYVSMSALENDLKRLSYGERLLNLQRNMAMRRRSELFAKVHKIALIAFAVILPVYAVYIVFVDPNSWRGQLASAIRYQDSADKVIQQIIADLPRDNHYEWNLAYLLWNQAQIIRMKSTTSADLLPGAISRYREALDHLQKFTAADGANPRLRSQLTADCFDGLCRCYLQQLKSGAKVGELASSIAEKAVDLRRQEMVSLGHCKDTVDSLSQSLALLAQVKTALGDDPKEIDTVLSEEEKVLSLYDPGSWRLAECLSNQAENSGRLGLFAEAMQKLREAMIIEASIYGMGSQEVALLQGKLNVIRNKLSTQQLNHSARL